MLRALGVVERPGRGRRRGLGAFIRGGFDAVPRGDVEADSRRRRLASGTRRECDAFLDARRGRIQIRWALAHGSPQTGVTGASASAASRPISLDIGRLLLDGASSTRVEGGAPKSSPCCFPRGSGPGPVAFYPPRLARPREHGRLRRGVKAPHSCSKLRAASYSFSAVSQPTSLRAAPRRAPLRELLPPLTLGPPLGARENKGSKRACLRRRPRARVRPGGGWP